jgi:hypothetical protein
MSESAFEIHEGSLLVHKRSALTVQRQDPHALAAFVSHHQRPWSISAA